MESFNVKYRNNLPTINSWKRIMKGFDYSISNMPIKRVQGLFFDVKDKSCIESILNDLLINYGDYGKGNFVASFRIYPRDEKSKFINKVKKSQWDRYHSNNPLPTLTSLCSSLRFSLNEVLSIIDELSDDLVIHKYEKIGNVKVFTEKRSYWSVELKSYNEELNRMY